MKADHTSPDAGATSVAAVTPLSVMSLTLRLTIACMHAAARRAKTRWCLAGHDDGREQTNANDCIVRREERLSAERNHLPFGRRSWIIRTESGSFMP